MGYTLRFGGFSISCGTLDELEALVDRQQQARGALDRARSPEAPPPRALPAAPAPPSSASAREIEPAPVARRRRTSRASPSPTSGSSGSPRSFTRAQILRAFVDRDPMRGSDAADALGAVGVVERGRVSASVSGLAKIGKLDRLEDGRRFRLAPDGVDYLRRADEASEDGETDEARRDDAEAEADDDEDEEEEAEEEAEEAIVEATVVPDAEPIDPMEPPGARSDRMALRLNADRWLDEPSVPTESIELRVPAQTRRERPEGVSWEEWRGRRHREVQAKTESMRRFSKARLKILGQEFPEDTSVGRPATRADCASVARPCPYVGCRHNLYLDVSPKTGAIKYNFPDLEPDEMHPERSCALDVIDAHPGGVQLEVVGDLLNVTRERVRQIEANYASVLREGAKHLRDELVA